MNMADRTLTLLRRPFAAALLLLGLTFAGIGTATVAQAAPSCPSGYVCLFGETDGANANKFSGDHANFFSTLDNYQSKIMDQGSNLDNNVEAVFYNWQYSPIAFYRNAYAGSFITKYSPGQQGFRNWVKSNCNVLSSHYEL
jgi:hypothetical protein